MSASSAIGMVSESLRDLLLGEMNPPVNVTILAPDEGGGDPPRINLFLYKVQENAFLKNLDWQVKVGEPGTLVPPPLSLKLSYLMTPYAENVEPTGNSTAHQILGEAMRVLYEYPILPEDYLSDGLKEAAEQIRITQNTLDLDELSKVWSTFTQPFRLSVLYEVSVVQLDMSAGSEQAMPPRVQSVGTTVLAPFVPPTVDSIDPADGSAGSTITFYGRNLSGWKAYVIMMGRLILDGQNISGDSFDVTVPNDIPPGFHQIRVDVSHLFRKTFFFEVQ
jgi:hypothetical protein